MITEIIFRIIIEHFIVYIIYWGCFYAKCKYKRKKSTCIGRYEFIVFLLFLWIFIVCIIFTEFDYESITVVQWELKWILYLQ